LIERHAGQLAAMATTAVAVEPTLQAVGVVMDNAVPEAATIRAQMGPESRLVFRDGCAGTASKNALVHAAEWLALRSGFTRSHGRLHFHDEAGWRRLLAECGLRVESARPELGLLSNLVLVCSRADRP